MVFKVLCCVLLACTLADAFSPRLFGFARTLGGAASDTVHKNVDSVGKASHAIVDVFGSGYDATVHALESGMNIALTGPKIAGKTFGKLFENDNSKVEEAVTSAPSAQSKQSKPSVDTTEAAKVESSTQSEKSGQSEDTTEAAKDESSTQSEKSDDTTEAAKDEASAQSPTSESSADTQSTALPDEVKAAASEILNAGVDAASDAADALVAAGKNLLKAAMAGPGNALKLIGKIGESDNSKVEDNTEAAKTEPSGKPVDVKSTSISDKLKEAGSEVLDENNKSIKKVFNAGVDAAHSTGKAVKQTAKTFMTLVSSPFRFASKSLSRWF